MDAQPITSADEINADEWEPVTTIATGRTYAIRRVWPMELAMNGLLLMPGVDSLEDLRERAIAGKQLSPDEARQVDAFQNALICLGMVDPVVMNRPRGECPPGAVSIDSLSPDRPELFLAIRKKAHFGDEAVTQEPEQGARFQEDESPAVDAGAPAAESVSH